MLDQLLTQFLDHLRYERNVSAHTLRNYESDLRQFFEYLASDLNFSLQINPGSESCSLDVRIAYPDARTNSSSATVFATLQFWSGTMRARLLGESSISVIFTRRSLC